MTQALKEIIEMVASWTPQAQEMLLSYAQEIEGARTGEVYHATEEELVGIDRGLKDADEGVFATESEINALFAKYR